VIVAPDARGRGLGGVLMKAVERCALANGCKRLTLLTDGDNADAQQFYERHGFTRSTMLPMRRFL
jgi:GNAT superfamily N-acetyltransferase